MHALRDTTPDAPSTEVLERLRTDGYVFVRGMVPEASVLDVREAVLETLAGLGWLEDGIPTGEARPSERARREEVNPDPAFFEAYRAVQALQPLHELAHHPRLVATMRSLLGEPLLVHPRKIVRIGLPQDDLVAPAHQDYPLIQGTPDVLTTWIPLGDCPDQLGGLRVIPGSHRRGLRPVRANPKVGGLEVDEDIDDAPEWATADFRAGDVLFFHSLTVHAAKRNSSDRLRLSTDFRYQAAAEPVVEGSLGPHYHPTLPDYEELCRGWTSRASVTAPDGLTVVAQFDPLVGPGRPLQSRLLDVA